MSRCEYRQMDKPEELLRDRIVCGVRDDSLRQQFLSKTDLSLANCIDLCRAHEASARQVKDMAGAEKVHVVKKSKPERITTETPRKPRDTRCDRCGLYHGSSPEDCPAYNALYLNCGKKGYYARKCRREEMPHDKQKWAGKSKGKVGQFQDDNDSEHSEDSATTQENTVERKCLMTSRSEQGSVKAKSVNFRMTTTVNTVKTVKKV